MRHAFSIAGNDCEVWLSRTTAGYHLHGDAGEADIALTRQGCRVLLTIDGRTEPAFLVLDGEDIHVHLRGRTFALRHLDPARRYAESDMAGGADVARAPMPGTVVRLAAEVGQEVTAGDPLLVIESMKLETTIRATHAATVAAIHVATGQSFDRDAVLVTLDGEAA